MWDVLVRAPRGSNNPRKFSMLLATFLVALLGYTFAASPTVSAVDATWDGDNISYDGNTYLPYPSGATLPDGITDDQTVYHFIDTSKTPRLIYFIAFPSGSTPQSEKEATYVRYTMNPPNRFINPTDEQTIKLTPATEAGTPDTSDGTFAHQCTVDGIGWIVCPIMNGISEGMDLVYNAISGYLIVQPISTSVDNPIYRIWVYSRDIANIAFVIGFLIIIYSYLIGGGFTGYEIRKILPRLAIAAILINLSYILSAIAVDISNIAGSSINQLFEIVRDDVLAGSTGDSGGEVNWTSVTTWVLAGGVGAAAGATILPSAIGGAAAGLWFLLAPFLLGAALLVMVTFLILAARQAIIVVLIAIAPIACAAFILPNTEKWFERWRDTFFTMLVMFPAFGAIFGASQLAGELIIRMAKANGSIEQIILGLGVMVAPLAVTPLLLKLGGGVLNRFGGIINNSQKGVFDRFKNYNNERRADFLAKQQHHNAKRDENGNLVNTGFMRRAAYRGDMKKYNRQRLREANTAMAQQLYDADDNGIETARSKARRRYANTMGRTPVDPSYKYGSQEIADLAHRTELQKNFTHGRRDDHWQHELQSDAGLRTMLTDTRDFEGKAALRSEAMKAEDDRTFQTNLDTNAAYANLRGMKVGTSVDSGVADIHKSAVDTAGKLALSTVVSNSPDLVAIKTRTYANEKRADRFETKVQKAAEANWSDTVREDASTQALYLQAQQAEDTASRAEQQLKTFVQNVRVKGKDAPEVAQSARQYADAIQDLVLETDVYKNAEATAQSNERSAIAKAYRENEALRTRAGGIGGERAANLVYAKAFQTMVSDQIEGTKAEMSLLSQTNSNEIFDRMDDPTRSVEQLSAYAGTIAKRGFHADHIKLLAKSSRMYQAAVQSGDQDQVDKMRDMIQQVKADLSKNAFGLRDYDHTLLSEGRYDGNIFKTTRERILTNLSPEVMASMDPDDIHILYEMHNKNLLSPEQSSKIREVWQAWQDDDNLKAKIQPKHRNFFERIETGDYTSELDGQKPPLLSKYGLTEESFDDMPPDVEIQQPPGLITPPDDGTV